MHKNKYNCGDLITVLPHGTQHRIMAISYGPEAAPTYHYGFNDCERTEVSKFTVKQTLGFNYKLVNSLTSEYLQWYGEDELQATEISSELNKMKKEIGI